MDHKAFENEMIDAVNRHADARSEQVKPAAPESKVFTKKDAAFLKRGLKRTGFALLTILLIALAVFGFIATATATGYWAVILFLASIVISIWAFVFVYAQGVVPTDNRGESK